MDLKQTAESGRQRQGKHHSCCGEAGGCVEPAHTCGVSLPCPCLPWATKGLCSFHAYALPLPGEGPGVAGSGLGNVPFLCQELAQKLLHSEQLVPLLLLRFQVEELLFPCVSALRWLQPCQGATKLSDRLLFPKGCL